MTGWPAESATTQRGIAVGRDRDSWYRWLMEQPDRLSRLVTRLGEAVKGWLRRQRHAEPPVAMIGLPPSARGLTGRPTDLALHAEVLAHEWADVGESYCRKRMRELGVPEDKIGVRRRELNYRRAAFLPGERDGGGVTPDGINVDSGVLNPELNAEAIGPEASSLWARSRLRDRIDAVIAHEHEERIAGSHDDAVFLAVGTPLPISNRARRILEAIADHEARRGR